MSNRKTWRSLRNSGTGGKSNKELKAAEVLSQLHLSHAGLALEEYLSAILLEVCPKNTHEALLEDRGRKALASELLYMLNKDGQHNETEPTTE